MQNYSLHTIKPMQGFIEVSEIFISFLCHKITVHPSHLFTVVAQIVWTFNRRITDLDSHSALLSMSCIPISIQKDKCFQCSQVEREFQREPGALLRKVQTLQTLEFKQNGGAVGRHSYLIPLKRARRPKYCEKSDIYCYLLIIFP